MSVPSAPKHWPAGHGSPGPAGRTARGRARCPHGLRGLEKRRSSRWTTPWRTRPMLALPMMIGPGFGFNLVDCRGVVKGNENSRGSSRRRWSWTSLVVKRSLSTTGTPPQRLAPHPAPPRPWPRPVSGPASPVTVIRALTFGLGGLDAVQAGLHGLNGRHMAGPEHARHLGKGHSYRVQTLINPE